MLDQVLTLMAQTEPYRRMPIEAVVRCVMPPLALGQHMALHDDGVLVGYVSWAYMSQNIVDKFLECSYPVQAEDWSSGNVLVFMDFVAPHGHAKILHRACRDRFPNQKFRYARYSRRRKVEVMNRDFRTRRI